MTLHFGAVPRDYFSLAIEGAQKSGDIMHNGIPRYFNEKYGIFVFLNEEEAVAWKLKYSYGNQKIFSESIIDTINDVDKQKEQVRNLNKQLSDANERLFTMTAELDDELERIIGDF